MIRLKAGGRINLIVKSSCGQTETLIIRQDKLIKKINQLKKNRLA